MSQALLTRTSTCGDLYGDFPLEYGQVAQYSLHFDTAKMPSPIVLICHSFIWYSLKDLPSHDVSEDPRMHASTYSIEHFLTARELK